ncbi:hypothetical protein D3C77_457530 [compost metagenome]
MIQPPEIFSLFRAFVMKHGFIGFWIHVIFTIAGNSRCKSRLVRYRNHDLPIVGIQRQGNRGLAIRRRMLRYVLFEYVFKIMDCFDLRIT